MQVAVEHNLQVHQLDVKTAYLNAPIDCEAYVRQPEGFQEKGDGVDMVWKLNRSLYGLKQSGRNWNIVLTQLLTTNGFVQSKVDVCLFVLHLELIFQDNFDLQKKLNFHVYKLFKRKTE